MFTTLSNGRPGIRSLLQIEARSPSGAGIPDSPSSHVKGAGNVAELSNDSILDFIVSDESLDRFGEVISASGWRLEAYRRNPVFQNAHQYGDILYTLGKALITEVRLAAPRQSEGGSALATPRSALRNPHLFQRIQFATGVNPMARIAYGLYRGRFLNAVSVGFIPLRWQDGTTVAAGVPPAVAGGVSPSGTCRRKYLEQELLEVSAVAIPANPNALALGLKSGAVDKSDLRETLELLRGLGIASVRPSGQRRSARSGNAGIPSSDRQPATCDLQLLTFARELRRILRRG